MSEDRPRATWPPSRRWFLTTGALMVVAAGGGIALGLATTDDPKPARTAAPPPPTNDGPAPTLSGSAFTSSRAGVACQAAAEILTCSRAGAGRATLTTEGELKIDRNADAIPGGPALAPGQTWEAIGIRCNEQNDGLRCLTTQRRVGFFVDTRGFVKR